MKRRIVLLGPPASGKGTQAALIEDRLGIPTVSTGEALRNEKAAGTKLGEEADRYTSQGRLVPDSIAIQVVGRWLEHHGHEFVFDGFPRSISQAEGLAALLCADSQSLDVVCFLRTSEETIQRRVLNRMVCESCGRTVSVGLHVERASSPCPSCRASLVRRSDDTLETLARRMEEYRTKTEPLIDYYRGRGLLETVDSEETPEVVFEEISQILEVV